MKTISFGKILQYSCLLIILVISCHAGDNENISKSNKDDCTLSQLIDSLHINTNQIIIRIDKSAYTLSLIYDTLVLKKYPVVFGRHNSPDKLMQGDKCTPEGTFKVKSKYPHKSWSKFIWIDYPNAESWEKHNAAKKEGRIAADAAIGGEIGIHGVPEGSDILIELRFNWTLGCIAMKNEDVNEIYPYVCKSQVVIIQK